MFLHIDNWLFDKVFQPFVDWCIDTHQRGPHWLAAISAFLYAGTIIAGMFMFPEDNSLFQNFITAVAVVIALVLGMRESAKDLAMQHRTEETMNELRINPITKLLRGVALALVVISCINLPLAYQVLGNVLFLDLFRVFLFLSFLYFEACNTRPPKVKRQVQEELSVKPV